MKKILTLLFFLAATVVVRAVDPDMIVTLAGDALQVYNLDYSPADFCYYTSTPESDDLKRIKKSEILIIKLADGTKIDPADTQPVPKPESVPAASANPKPEPLTITTDNSFEKGKKGAMIIKVADENGNIVCYRLNSDTDKTLAVTKPAKNVKYDAEKYRIPEYIVINGDTYAVTGVDPEAFFQSPKQNFIGASWRTDVKDIIFPETLVEIGKFAFFGNGGLKRLVLPESLRKVGENAFRGCGVECPNFEQLYIPKGIEEIATNGFNSIGPDCSYRGFFQGNLTSIPDFITESNCTRFGIDEEAVRAYNAKYRK